MPKTVLEEEKLVEGVIVPVTLSPEKLKAFSTSLVEDIKEARRARDAYDDKLIKWERQYEAMPEQDIKTFPWKNASNIVAPMTAIAVDAIEARLEAELIAKPEMVVARSLRGDELKDVAEPLERYLNHAARQENDLDTENCLRELLPDTALNGISFIKVPYVYETKDVPEFNRDTRKVSYRQIVSHNGPKHVWVSVCDILWPEGTVDIQRSRWFAQRFYLEWWQLIERSQNPVYGYSRDRCGDIRSYLEKKVPKDVQAHYNVIGFSHEPLERLELYEVYIRSDVEKKEDYQNYIVTIHPESATIIKMIRHFYAHQKRPYVPFFYTKRRKSIVGNGVGAMLERLQDGVTTSLNQMIDNSTAANTVVLKVKKGALRTNEEIYPMKRLYIDGEIGDVEQFRLGENASGMVNAINILRDYAERRSGVTDYQLGMESTTVGTRATAAGTLSLIQEGNKQIDRHIRLFRNALNELWEMTVVTYQQFAPIRKIIGLLGKDAEKVIDAFSFPSEWIFDKIAVTVSASTSSANREIEKQNSITLFNMLMGYYEKIVEISMSYPMLPPIPKAAIDKALTALNELLEKILRSFDQYDVENFMIMLDEIQRQTAMAGMPGGMPGGPGGNGAGARPPQGVIPQPGGGGPPGAMVPGAPPGGGPPMPPS